MIDLHVHLLPGVDDGPATLEQSLALARVLVQEGVHTCVATPHYNDQYPQRSATDILSRVATLQEVLIQQQIPLQIRAGHEVLIKPGLVDDLRTGRIATLNGGRYVLLELWTTTWLPETARVIFELRAAGYIPVLAHPERYCTLQDDPRRVVALRSQGVLMQVTIGSLIGMQGRSAQRCASTLLKKDLVDCLASDAHSLGQRRPAILASLRTLNRLVKPEKLHQLLETKPAEILQDVAVPI
jgi:protein-tyrosine phosphatase